MQHSKNSTNQDLFPPESLPQDEPHAASAARFPLPPYDVHASIQKLYQIAGLTLTSAPVPEIESAEYGAFRLALSGKNVVFRIAKTTPTKIGQFVTLWKRPSEGDEIAPFDSSDAVDFMVVSVHDASHRGQFVFNRKQLLAEDVMSRNGEGGKRAIRVYPAWCRPTVKQAIKTQQWQLRHFFAISDDDSANSERIRKLFEM